MNYSPSEAVIAFKVLMRRNGLLEIYCRIESNEILNKIYNLTVDPGQEMYPSS